ncbi:DUF2530 domain-containing protein [uncultured Aeromicrobium sp.]|uniref:DUF2530 domain-containing protein n=1 Tax=uncultured Aeromicrobium sp. TaxID=337820 RepID=UPI0025FDD903|nr:DUF2530 domain-containing protein [uncultured Aeromicrobium sp.]
MNPADPSPESQDTASSAAERAARRHELGHPDITEIEIGKTTHRVAEVQPMDVDGVRTMTVGTILWAVAAIALLPFWGTLREDGNQWWLWSALAGFGLGLIGIEYCRRRRNALMRQRENRASGGGRRRR